MRAVRFFCFTLLMVAGFAGAASAQGSYNNTPGIYEGVKVGVVPAALPPGSLPGDLPKLGPDLYVGTLTVVRNADGSYNVSYKGVRYVDGLEERAKLNVNATFNSSWAGIKQEPLIVGGSVETIITGIDGANLISANINGVGTVDGGNKRVIARFGAGAVLLQFKELKEPGYLR